MARTVLDLDRYVPALLTFIANKLSNGSSATYRRHFGVGVTEWRIMALLAIEPGIPASRICQVIGFDKAQVSRTLRVLEKRGLVTVKADPNDGRRRGIRLTRTGDDLHDRIIDVALERERILLASCTAAEIDQLTGLLRRLHAQIPEVNAYAPGAPPNAKTRQRRARQLARAG